MAAGGRFKQVYVRDSHEELVGVIMGMILLCETGPRRGRIGGAVTPTSMPLPLLLVLSSLGILLRFLSKGAKCLVDSWAGCDTDWVLFLSVGNNWGAIPLTELSCWGFFCSVCALSRLEIDKQR